MGLETQSPLRMRLAVGDGGLNVLLLRRIVFGLQEEVLKGERFKARGVGEFLGVDELELMALARHQLRVGFGADADPVDAVRQGHGAVRLNRDLEVRGVQGIDQLCVELESGFAAGADDVSLSVVFEAIEPAGGDFFDELGGGVFATTWSVYTDEVGVAKLPDRVGAIGFASGPEVTAGEA